MVVGRVAVGEVAADGGQVAHEGIGDDPRRLVQQRVPRAHELGFLEVRLPGEGADAQHAVGLADTCQPRDAVDVDHVRGAGEAQLHQRDEALAPRQHLGVFEIFVNDLAGLADIIV